MVTEVMMVVIFGWGKGCDRKGHKGRFWGSGNYLFVELSANNMNVITS